MSWPLPETGAASLYGYRRSEFARYLALGREKGALVGRSNLADAPNIGPWLQIFTLDRSVPVSHLGSQIARLCDRLHAPPQRCP